MAGLGDAATSRAHQYNPNNVLSLSWWYVVALRPMAVMYWTSISLSPAEWGDHKEETLEKGSSTLCGISLGQL